MLAKVRRLTLHPFLFGTYPIFSLLANNVGEVLVEDALRALIVSMVGVVGLLIVFRLLFRDWQRASLVTTLSVILFFSYGHMYQFLRYETALGTTFGRHRYLALVWLVIFSVGIWLIWRRIRASEAWTEALNLIVAIALVFPIFQIARYELRMASARANQDGMAIMSAEEQLSEGVILPDIYHIVLDAYAREDALRAFYLYDNSDFIQSLEDFGFYIAHESQSNYAWTEVSLGSTLNLNYLSEFSDQFVAGNQDLTELHQLVRDNLVRRSLSDLGYMEITFKTGHYHTEFEDSDLYLTPSQDSSSQTHSLWRLNKYETMLLHTTAAWSLIDGAKALGFLVTEFYYPYMEHRQIVLSALEKLEQIPSIEGPKYVFAHIICPHVPMIFGPNGEFVDPSTPFTFASDLGALEGHERMIGYRDQVTFINKRMEHILKMIFMKSVTEPIIILQGDHGGPMGDPIPTEARMTILNAYYLPHGGSELLYDTISPVNTFRLIFDYYFGSEYGFLEDVAYYSPYDDVFNFQVITNEIYEAAGD